jgi:hypothetical protein
MKGRRGFSPRALRKDEARGETPRPTGESMKKCFLLMLCVAGLYAADKGWPWAGSQNEKAVTILLLGREGGSASRQIGLF